MNRPTDGLDLGEYVPFYVRAIANRLAQAASREYKAKFGIGLNEWSCLGALARWTDISAARICEISGFDKALVSRSLRALESKGLITSRSAPNGSHKRLIRLTPAGRSLHDQILTLALAREQRLLKGIPAQERAGLLSFLRTMHTNALSLADGSGDEEAKEATPRRGTVAMNLEE
jgi:DNA-binding MarR family transcriptional regulator